MHKLHQRTVPMAALAIALATTASASATILTLEDGNSTVTINTATPSNVQDPRGVTDWVVDGTDHLFEQWFWYRVGNTGPEQSVDSLDELQAVSFDTPDIDPREEQALIRYGSTADEFEIELKYILTGGPTGTDESDLAEIIRITNTSETDPLDFSFFQYSDFHVGGIFSIGDDFGQIDGGNTARTGDVTTSFSETVVTPLPSKSELEFFSDTRDKLIDGDAEDLNRDLDTSSKIIGPGDVTWAFQWDFTLAPGEAFIISKDKNIRGEPFNIIIPEPSTLLMILLISVAGFVCRRVRR